MIEHDISHTSGCNQKTYRNIKSLETLNINRLRVHLEIKKKEFNKCLSLNNGTCLQNALEHSKDCYSDRKYNGTHTIKWQNVRYIDDIDC